MQGRGEKKTRGGSANRGSGSGKGSGRKGGPGGGAGGECVCPSCGKRTPHQRGVPCKEMSCPECGGAMTRG